MSQIRIRIDDDLKLEAEKVLKEMELTMTSAITMFLTKVAKEKRIPFEVCVDPFYSPENIAELERRTDNMKKGIDIVEHELIETAL